MEDYKLPKSILDNKPIAGIDMGTPRKMWEGRWVEADDDDASYMNI
jgi:hypothetical protein